ncbi:hypothetical protein JXA47_11585 [Candidatus Sumerlaeota bacterium]|nr:hypothetical protein [Candidatus Sumerlaeota bacterium]
MRRRSELRRALCRALLALAIAVIPLPLPGWGGFGHRLMTEAAVDNLPTAMFSDGSGNAFNDWRQFLIDHGSHPDALKSHDDLESPRHWVDMDTDGIYTYPFDDLPRDLAEYLQVFDRDNGVNPWEGVSDHFDGLVQAFRTRNWNAVYRVAADLGHYIEDCTQPFHSTANYDGQFTGNDGIHSRHESELVNRHIVFADLQTRRSSPPLTDPMRDVTDRVEFGFDALIQGYSHIGPILAADNAARAVDPSYGVTYYQLMFAAIGDETIDQLEDGAQRLADLWHTAWVLAGQPSFDPAPQPRTAPVIDAVIDGDLSELTGGAELQTNTTDLEDNGGELDRLLMARTADDLVIGLAGNVAVGQAVVLLLDTAPGGSSTLSPSTGPIALRALSGESLDPSFTPDRALVIERTAMGLTVHLADLVSDLASVITTPVALDSSNTGGVSDRDGQTVLGAENVLTGIEVSVTLSALAITEPSGAHVGAIAILSESGTGEVSNQTLPGFPLGEFALEHPFTETTLADLGFALFELGVAETQIAAGLLSH